MIVRTKYERMIMQLSYRELLTDVAAVVVVVPVVDALVTDAVPVVLADVAEAESVLTLSDGSAAAPATGMRLPRRLSSAGTRFLIIRPREAWSRGV